MAVLDSGKLYFEPYEDVLAQRDQANAALKAFVWKYGEKDEFGKVKAALSRNEIDKALTDLDLKEWMLQDPYGYQLEVSDTPSRQAAVAAKLTRAFENESGSVEVPGPETLQAALNNAFPGHRWTVS